MKLEILTNEQTASLCLELSLLLHAGVSAGDGLTLLAEQSDRAEDRALLTALAEQVDGGAPLAAALADCRRFPAYVSDLMDVGERSGRTEETLRALARYYEDRDRMDRQMRSALVYPSVLLALMLVVIVVLLTRVLPVFSDVYASLGGQLTGVAGGLLALGRGLDAAMPVLCVLLAAGLLLLAAFAAGGRFRAALGRLWQTWRGDKGLGRQMGAARLAQALAMALQSGLPTEEALALAGRLQGDAPAAKRRCDEAQAALAAGHTLPEALQSAQVLPAAACRLLALGQRSGTGDTVMAEVARRLGEESQLALERQVGRVEPALVLGSSLLVGAILLSVMLPLMHIMTAIG